MITDPLSQSLTRLFDAHARVGPIIRYLLDLEEGSEPAQTLSEVIDDAIDLAADLGAVCSAAEVAAGIEPGLSQIIRRRHHQ